MPEIAKTKLVAVLNRLLEAELAGIVRDTRYSFLVFGFGKIPIISWLREQASESLFHAQQVVDESPHWVPIRPWSSGLLPDSHKHDITAILRE